MIAEKSLLVVPIRHPDQLKKLSNDMTTLFERFLKKAREPFPVTHQWLAVLRALAEPERTLFLIALNERVRPVGYALVQSGYTFWGVKQANVVQMYAQVPGVVETLEARIVEWATAQDCQVISAASRRTPQAVVKRFKMEPYAVTYIRTLGDGHGQGLGDTA